MSPQLDPYIHFKGNTREAMEFYKSVFGGELEMSTFADIPGLGEPELAERIAHASLETGNGFIVMASDVIDESDFKAGNNVSLSLGGSNEDELRGYFDQLSADGNVVEPIAPAPWGGLFGIVVDGFGLTWFFSIMQEG